MKTSIIIPVFNRVDFTQKCLESIFQAGSRYPFEVIVVDNASSDGTEKYLESLEDKIITIRNEKNLGFAKACNQGAGIAKGKYLLFLNNDTIVTEGWLDILVEELDDDFSSAAAGSKLLYPDDTIQHAGVVFGEDKIPYHIYARERKEKHYVNKKRKFNAVTAACMLVRKDIFKKVGGFDENFVNGYEDVDLCLRIKETGKDIVYCPQSVVYHYESISEGRADKLQENKVLFLEKWGSKIKQDDYRYTLEDDTHEQNSIIIDQKKELAELRNELQIITSSKFWKIRNLYMKYKSKIFS